MTVFTRRRALLFSLTAPFCAALVGCDPNPNGPTFPTVKPEAEDEEDDAGSDPGAPGSKGKGGRRKKNATSGMINDPAA